MYTGPSIITRAYITLGSNFDEISLLLAAYDRWRKGEKFHQNSRLNLRYWTFRTIVDPTKCGKLLENQLIVRPLEDPPGGGVDLILVEIGTELQKRLLALHRREWL